MSSNDPIWDALKHVDDPEVGIDIVNLGLIYDVAIENGHVQLTMTLTSAACPSVNELALAAKVAVGQLEGVKSVEIEWTFDPPWTPEMITQEGRDYLETMGML